MVVNRSISSFAVVLPNGQSVQIEVEPGRTAGEIAETIARKAGIAIPSGHVPELYMLSIGESLTGTARNLAQLSAMGDKIGIRTVKERIERESIKQNIYRTEPSPRTDSFTGKPRKGRRKTVLVTLSLVFLVMVIGGYWVGWYLNALRWPVHTIAGRRGMYRDELLDVERVHSFLNAHPPQSCAVYAQGIPLLPEPNWTMYYTDFPVASRDSLNAWFVYNQGGYYIFGAGRSGNYMADQSENYIYPDFFTLIAVIHLERLGDVVVLKWSGVPPQ